MQTCKQCAHGKARCKSRTTSTCGNVSRRHKQVSGTCWLSPLHKPTVLSHGLIWVKLATMTTSNAPAGISCRRASLCTLTAHSSAAAASTCSGNPCQAKIANVASCTSVQHFCAALCAVLRVALAAMLNQTQDPCSSAHLPVACSIKHYWILNVVHSCAPCFDAANKGSLSAIVVPRCLQLLGQCR